MAYRPTWESGNWRADCLKQCSNCKVEKSLESFYKQKDGKYKVTSRCKACIKLLSKDYQNSLEYRAKKKIAEAKRIKNNPNAILKKRQQYRNWRVKNKPYDALRSSLRRASIKKATPSWVDIYDSKCIYEEASYFQMHVDHIVPINSDIRSEEHTSELQSH